MGQPFTYASCLPDTIQNLLSQFSGWGFTAFPTGDPSEAVPDDAFWAPLADVDGAGMAAVSDHACADYNDVLNHRKCTPHYRCISMQRYFFFLRYLVYALWWRGTPYRLAVYWLDALRRRVYPG